MNTNEKPKTATEYWQQRKVRDAARRKFSGPTEAQRIAAIRAHVCGPSCGPVCTRFDW